MRKTKYQIKILSKGYNFCGGFIPYGWEEEIIDIEGSYQLALTTAINRLKELGLSNPILCSGNDQQIIDGDKGLYSTIYALITLIDSWFVF